MPQYHGDIMFNVGNVYKRQDDRNYPVTLILLFFFGWTGAHRFYLNDHTLGWAYLLPFAASIFISFATLKFVLFLWFIGIASLVLLAEFFYLTYRWVKQADG